LFLLEADLKKVEKGKKKKLEVKKEKVAPLTDDDLDKVAGGTLIYSVAMSAVRSTGGPAPSRGASVMTSGYMPKTF
jgi:hypothetical protein